MNRLLLFVALFFVLDLPSYSFQSDTLRSNDLLNPLIEKEVVASIDTTELYEDIFTIVKEAIDSLAFPGAQILIAKFGKTVFNHSFGYHTYDSLIRVKNHDLFDLASITKTVASTLALMKLYDDGKLDLDRTLAYYLPYLKRSNKKNLTIREVLAHQAGLKNWIPFYSESQRKNGKYRKKTISSDSSATYPDRIPGSDLFLHKDYQRKRLFRMIKKSKVSTEKKYVYSGLAFYLFPELVEQLSGMSFQEFLYTEFYKPMKAESIGFLPRTRFPLENIVPTEVDDFFRMDSIHGDVHDEGAALMLGISGNAGLFSNALDLAKIYQMFLGGGYYQGQQYLKKSTTDEFTRCQYCEEDNRRGLGFDKPLIVYDSVMSSVAKDASPQSYGHSGYTGTLVWADPVNGLLFVFLSNRVYPSRQNKMIYRLNIRPRIHDLIYKTFEK